MEVSIVRFVMIVGEDVCEWKGNVAEAVDDRVLLRVYNHVT